MTNKDKILENIQVIIKRASDISKKSRKLAGLDEDTASNIGFSADSILVTAGNIKELLKNVTENEEQGELKRQCSISSYLIRLKPFESVIIPSEVYQTHLKDVRILSRTGIFDRKPKDFISVGHCNGMITAIDENSLLFIMLKVGKLNDEEFERLPLLFANYNICIGGSVL